MLVIQYINNLKINITQMNNLSLFFLVFALLCSTIRAQTNSNPNIIFILADDLGYGDISFYNPEAKVQTPNLDRLASEGIRFTDAHSPSTVCAPTRYSIMTGQMEFRLGFPGVFSGIGGPGLISENRLTLPRMLQEKGYETAMFGKWHIGMTFLDKNGKAIYQKELPEGATFASGSKLRVEGVRQIDYSRAVPDAPIHRGFDHFYGTVSCPGTDWLYTFMDGDRIPVPPTHLLDRDKLPRHEWGFDCRIGMIAPNYNLEELDMVFLEKSMDFLENHRKKSPDKPFFLFHSTAAVHLPSFAAENFKGKTNAGPHGDFIFEFDYIVGQLLEKLDTLGLTDNTLIIVTSDNGSEVSTVINMREKYQHDGARPWRGMKRDNWEGGHRVPMIARWPGKIKANRKDDRTVCLTDIMATCAAIVGAKLPNDAAEDSYNILPILLGESNEEIRHFTLHQTNRLELAIRKDDWKYLDHKGSGGNNYEKEELKKYTLPEMASNAPGQLYNLKVDPGETMNLYFKFPEIVREMKGMLEEFKESGRSAPKR